ncbi:MAG: lysyl-tRNA synthetase class 2 [Gammaproteobacteria bacterium]|jgi:lysyl-tRNA synthetase class 2
MAWQPSASFTAIKQRARIYRQIRAFFDARAYFEVDTPLLSPTTNTDANIESIKASNLGQTLYLQTSPEFAMKRLLAAGSGSIYQICHAFREGEKGRRHNPEFTLLEWYRVGFEYQELMDEIECLIDDISGESNQYQRISYRQLVLDHISVDIDTIKLLALRQKVDQHIPGTRSSELDVDQCLDLLISLAIAPKIKGYVFVYDYPISQASLARVKVSEPTVAERFELFHNGLELANGFSELCDSSQQRQRFEGDNNRRLDAGLEPYPVDELLLSALDSGLPECAGVAIGLDRLMMVLLEKNSIDQVLSFVE